MILDGGTTVMAVAKELASKSIHVITNSLPIAESAGILSQYRIDTDGRLSQFDRASA